MFFLLTKEGVNFFLFERKKLQKRSKNLAGLSLIDFESSFSRSPIGYPMCKQFYTLLCFLRIRYHIKMLAGSQGKLRLKERGRIVAFVQCRVIHVGEIGLPQTCSRSVKKMLAERR